MNATVWGLVGLVVGVLVAVAVCRLLDAARSAAVVAERDLLRERVLDLETSLAEDMETAALLAPLKDALVRVESHVGVRRVGRVSKDGFEVRVRRQRVASRPVVCSSEQPYEDAFTDGLEQMGEGVGTLIVCGRPCGTWAQWPMII